MFPYSDDDSSSISRNAWSRTSLRRTPSRYATNTNHLSDTLYRTCFPLCSIFVDHNFSCSQFNVKSFHSTFSHSQFNMNNVVFVLCLSTTVRIERSTLIFPCHSTITQFYLSIYLLYIQIVCYLRSHFSHSH